MKEFSHQFNCKNFYFHYTMERAHSLAPYYQHSHSNYELYAFFEGEVEFIVENVSYNLKPNTILLIPPHKYHYAKITKLNTPYHRLTFLFDRALIPDNLQDLFNNEIKFFSLRNDNGVEAKSFQKLSHALKDYSEKDTELFLSLFLCNILLDLKYSNAALPSTANFAVNRSIDNILAFINEHIYEPLSLAYIAEALFLTPVYISQIFSKTMHISLMKYIKQKKLLLAHDLIRNGTKATNAALLLGFSDYSTFFRLYKKEFGHAPSEYTQDKAII